MSEKAEDLSRLEEDASRLVDTLIRLKAEVGSYNQASQDLTKTKDALLGFLQKTEALTQQTHKILSTLNEVGASDIYGKLEELRCAGAKNGKFLMAVMGIALLGLLVSVGQLIFR